jgi:hypothetical protein
MIRFAIALFAALTIAAAPATAQVQRNFPSNALRGTVQFVAASQVVLNGTTARLSPGARIRGANNMIAMSATLAGQKLVVNYTVDGQGELHDIWILTAQEAARLPWPTSAAEAQAWRFDPAAQTWTRP